MAWEYTSNGETQIGTPLWSTLISRSSCWATCSLWYCLNPFCISYNLLYCFHHICNQRALPWDLRPIILTMQLFKSLEWYSRKWLLELFNHLMDPQQFGWLKGSSVEIALADLLHGWLTVVAKPGTVMAVMFLDFRKAVDRISYHILLSKLKEHCALDWLVFVWQETTHGSMGHNIWLMCGKISKRIYFLVLLKRRGRSPSDIIDTHKVIIRSVLECAFIVWYLVLTKQ